MIEEPTYCRPGDTQRPSRVELPDLSTVQICPDDVTLPVQEFQKAFPAAWYARIVFDELLDLEADDPDEHRFPAPKLAGERAALVRLTCNGAEVPNVATYLSRGSRETWPMAPSIKVSPRVPSSIAANALCEIFLERSVIRDKSGLPPEPSQLGPYRFRLAPIEIIVPEGPARAPYGTTGQVPTLGAGNPAFAIDFNHYVDPETFAADSVAIYRDATGEDPQTPQRDCAGGVRVPARVEVAAPASGRPDRPFTVAISDASLAQGHWMSNSTYRVELGGTPIGDQAGGRNDLAPQRLCFRARP